VTPAQGEKVAPNSWAEKGIALETVVSLFAGAGGLSSGFAAAGLTPKLAVEIDRDACATYERNLGSSPLQADVSHPETVRSVASAMAGTEVSAVIGGPPCQGFSTAGGRWAEDPRNRLIFSYFGIVDALRPRWFLFENVEGLLTSGGGKAVVSLVKSFLERGYSIRLAKLNFAMFGLPQTRKRVVILGNRLGLDFELPLATHSFNSGKHKSSSRLPASPSLKEALAGLGEAARTPSFRVPYRSERAANPYDALMRGAATDVSMHYWAASDLDQERFRHLGPGQTMKDLPEYLWHTSYKRRANRRVMDGMPSDRRGGAPSGIKRLVGDLNALTITSATTREFIHPSEDRPLTLREAARLQSFSDSYEFEGNAVSQARQIGNAFPPICAEIFARQLMQADAQFGSGAAINVGPPRLIDYMLTEAAGMSPALRATDEALASMTCNQLPFALAAE